MFLVPKYLVGPDGELGERNGVRVTGVEHKMGLKASTTCELTFGADRPAVGTLVGGVHDGIRQMFLIIEHARMMVGTKAIATLSTGYLNALEYARQRVQGADMTQMADKTAPRVTIIHHPDVRRILMMQKAYAEGMRALMLYTASWQDAVQIAGAEGRTEPGSPGDLAARVNDLLLPIVKGVGSERAYELLTQSLQTYGGSGFIQDFPVEQYIRDAKIDSLYEGTTAIQGMDLFFRKTLRDQGVALGAVLSEIREFAAGEAGNGRLKTERAALAAAVDDVEAMVAAAVRVRARLAGAARRGLQGRAEQHPAADGPGRPAHRLAAGPPGRGRDGRALDQERWPRRGLLPGQAGHGAVLRETVLPRLAVERQIAETRHAGPHGAARRSVLNVRAAAQAAPRAQICRAALQLVRRLQLVLHRRPLGHDRLHVLPDDVPVHRMVPVDEVVLDAAEVRHHRELVVARVHPGVQATW